MFDLCLFDLDDTLVSTADLKEIREAGKFDASDAYKAEVLRSYHTRASRNIYSVDLIASIQNKFPKTKIGILTRSPRSYAHVVIREACRSIRWDVVIAYEDVKRTKPHGEGIHNAMDILGVKYLNDVMLVGDGDVDIRASYNAGVAVVLDKSSWSRKYSNDNWNALNHMPDMVIEYPSEIMNALAHLPKFQPDLERELSGFCDAPDVPRFDRIGKFIPRSAGGDNTPFQVFACGRSFANYESVSERKKWHELTASIHDNKDSDVFPEKWVQSIYRFIKVKMNVPEFGPPLVVSVACPHGVVRFQC